MYLRLRQLCLVARSLHPVVEDLGAILGLQVCFRDPAVGKYGLENALLPIGTSFLEVVAPIREGTAAGRYLDRRAGDGGYMVILDCDDLERRRRHVGAMGVRIANALSYGDYTGIQLHPRDTGGCMIEFNHTTAGEDLTGPYHPAGPSWQAAIRSDVTAGLLGAEIQGPDPGELARRWGMILERPVTQTGGNPGIALDGGQMLGFATAVDGRGEGLSGIDLRVVRRAPILTEAARRGYTVDERHVRICGVRFGLSELA